MLRALAGLGITDAEAGDVAEFLRKDKYAVNVDLSHNNLGNSGAAAIAEALTSNSTLTDLNLSHNAISDRGLTALCEVAVTKQNLCRMDVVGNRFGKNGIVTACLMVLARGPTTPKLVCFIIASCDLVFTETEKDTSHTHPLAHTLLAFTSSPRVAGVYA